MKFFTAAWAAGELPDEEYDAAFPAYEEHLASLSLPPDLQRLRDSDLHDGVVEAIERRSDTLTLSLIIGDLQRGYSSTIITYLGFDLLPGSLERLESLAADETIEILYDEVDRYQDRSVHRVLFSTHAHVEISFASVVITLSSRANRERRRSGLTPN